MNNQARNKAYIPVESVMIDIETHGSDANRHPILQIGAAVFNADFEMAQTFDACLSIPEDRQPDPDTLRWWMRTDPELYRELCGRAEPYRDVLERFADWLPDRPSLWAWPAYFDLAFIRSYAHSYQVEALEKKFHPYRWIDCRSWIAGIRRGLVTDEQLDSLIHKPPPFAGRIHDGLYDARWQVVCLKRVADLTDQRSENVSDTDVE